MAEENKRSTLNTTSSSVVQNYKDAIAAQSKAEQGLGGVWQGVGKITDDIIVTEELRRKKEETRRKKIEDVFDANAAAISESAGSLGTQYYDMAFDQAKILQVKFAQAVRDKDEKKMGKLRAELTMLSTKVGSLKANLENANGIHSDENGNTLLSNGMSIEQKRIAGIVMGTKYM